jgi:hypothetical protein
MINKTANNPTRTFIVWFLLPLIATIIAIRLLWLWSVRNGTISYEYYAIAFVVLFLAFLAISAVVDFWLRRSTVNRNKLRTPKSDPST